MSQIVTTLSLAPVTSQALPTAQSMLSTCPSSPIGFHGGNGGPPDTERVNDTLVPTPYSRHNFWARSPIVAESLIVIWSLTATVETQNS
eukprot:CAMPEP_0204492598 /NCGR_PEP_ID=MMETSP0471-20130131/80076_1 /ASSEMBLY_ACC=CAM_ASM_000602 /TAXON_ID=2969 /ORGANISM="Oxyrrhis marina" /LENGTH=88 /DNA_ID=CAMNT_0051496683 /DNA_START=63 /DNA_END=326 /DNA_ORIENTATION=+